MGSRQDIPQQMEALRRDHTPSSPDDSDRITVHFRRSEFQQPAGYGFPRTDYPAEWIPGRLEPLCRMLETIRGALCRQTGRDVGLTIISGYRLREYDDARRAAGHSGVSSSGEHPKGTAADIRAEGVSAEQVHALILDLVAQRMLPELGGLGLYPSLNFCHIDMGGKGRRWTG